MKAAVLKGPRDLVIEDVPAPEIGPDEVLIEVIACGVCGSDIRYYQGDNPWALHTLGRNVPNPPNIILGHEFCGRVVETGSAAFDHLMGQRVAVLPYAVCGVCPDCRSGNHNLCENMIHTGHAAGWGEKPYYYGGMAERCPAWGRRCFPVPEGLSDEEAALTDQVGVALHSTRAARMAPGKDVAVIGCGPIGLSIAQIARGWGARTVFLVDHSQIAIEIAGRLGFSRTTTATDRPIDDWLMDEASGRGVGCVWDTVGSAETLRAGVRALAKQGSLINVATHPVDLRLSASDLAGERLFRSSSNFLVHEFPDALDLVADGVVDVKPMITHRFPLQQTPEAFGRLADKERHAMFKAVIRLEDAPEPRPR